MRPSARVLLIILVGAVAALCLRSGAAIAFAVRQGAINVQGLTRTYSLYLPDSMAAPGRRAIVMMLHGGLGNGLKIAEQTGLGAYVDRGRFIAVFPDSGGQQWNDGRETTRFGPDDVAFLIALVRELTTGLGADPTRVFVGGGSNGGMMVQRLACEATDVFAAYAVAVANMPYSLAGSCRPMRRAPMIFFDSTTDPLMPWAGGEIRHGVFRGVGGRVLSTAATIDFWSRVDGCGGAETRDVPDRVNDGTHVKVHDFGSCGLIFYEIDGGGHTWPGGTEPQGPIARYLVGNTTHAINATAVMLDFFRRHGL